MNYFIMPGMKQTRSKARPMVPSKFEKDAVLKAVCDHFGITLEDIQENSRVRPIVYKRQIAMYFMTHYTDETYFEIGQLFNKDHTTVIYSKDQIRNLLDVDETVKADIEQIKCRLVEAYY